MSDAGAAATLVHVHDPMCSWCYAFRPAWRALTERLPAGVAVRRLLGGLAPDSDAPMPPALREKLQATWRQIERQVPGTRFNHAFWRDCAPRRSTYPACRAVLAARALDPAREEAMIAAIQDGYYRDARNPSDGDTLVALASAIGLDPAPFAHLLAAPATAARLEAEIAGARRLGATSFPTLLWLTHGDPVRLPLDYNDPRVTLDAIAELIEPR